MPTKVRADAGSRDSRYDGIGGNGGSRAMSFLEVEAEALRAAIEGVASEGDALVFGRTRDGGAFAIRVISDKQVYKWYPDSVEALQSVLQALSK